MYPGWSPDSHGRSRYGFLDRAKQDTIFLLKIILDICIPLVYMKTMTQDELRKWRTGNGYSQAKLAKALGVASMTVTRWEMGIRSIPPFLHLALKAIEGGDEKPNTGRKQKVRKRERRF